MPPSSLFTVLGVPPAMGRIFSEAEEAPGHRLVVISDGVWRTHLGGRPSAIGSSLRLNGEAYEVIGVMPRGFQFPWRNNGVWVPFALDRAGSPARFAFVLGRRARRSRSVTFESARAEIEQIGRALQQRYEENEDEGATITLMADQGLGTLRTMLTALMGAVSLVFLIACVNVANLQLGRALSRRREFAMRISLGAGHRPPGAAVVRGVARARGGRRHRRGGARVDRGTGRGSRAHAGVPRLTVPRRGADRD